LRFTADAFHAVSCSTGVTISMDVYLDRMRSMATLASCRFSATGSRPGLTPGEPPDGGRRAHRRRRRDRRRADRCALARELARRGARTVLLERAELAGESSRAAAGMVAPQAESERPGPLLRLALDSRPLYPERVPSLDAQRGLAVE
jgi:hypothetical protein